MEAVQGNTKFLCISLIISDVKTSLCVPKVFSINISISLEKIYSDPLPIFKLDCFGAELRAFFI